MDGVLIINKPKDFTSHDVVNVARKSLHEKKVGHTGTLDPNATGVLPILLGKATKLSKYLIEHNKEYVATIKLGETTGTGDSEGQIIEKDVNINNVIKLLNYDKIKQILMTFLGKQSQIPPQYSAIKVNGKKAYEYARKGQEIKLEPRDIEIYDIELINYFEDEITYRVICSKGTYIRTLCEDIAKKCGTIGFMKELTRTRINEFDIKKSITVEELKENAENIANKIIKIEDLFKNNESIILDDRKKELFLNGVQLTFNLINGIYKIYNKNEFIGLGIITNNLLKRDIVL